MQRMTSYQRTALCGILDIPHDAPISDSAFEVWDRMNDRCMALEARHARKHASTRQHVLRLEAKLTERRSEFVKTVVVGALVSHCRKFVMAQMREGNLYFPGAPVENGMTPGESLGIVIEYAGITANFPRELGVQRDEYNGVKTMHVFMGVIQSKANEDKPRPKQLGWYPIDDKRWSETERVIIQNLLDA